MILRIVIFDSCGTSLHGLDCDDETETPCHFHENDHDCWPLSRFSDGKPGNRSTVRLRFEEVPRVWPHALRRSSHAEWVNRSGTGRAQEPVVTSGRPVGEWDVVLQAAEANTTLGVRHQKRRAPRIHSCRLRPIKASVRLGNHQSFFLTPREACEVDCVTRFVAGEQHESGGHGLSSNVLEEVRAHDTFVVNDLMALGPVPAPQRRRVGMTKF